MSNTKDTPMDYKQFEGHTEGPWKYIEGDNATFPHVLIPMHYQLEGGEKFDRLVVNVGAGPSEVHESNAKLIAAAPDLLKENQSLKLELQKQNRRIEVYKSILDLADNKIHEWQKWEQVKDKELASKDIELQKQKELNAELVKCLKDIKNWVEDEGENPYGKLESLIKKSNEI